MDFVGFDYFILCRRCGIRALGTQIIIIRIIIMSLNVRAYDKSPKAS